MSYKKVKIPKKNLPESLDSREFKKLWLAAFSLEDEAVLQFYEFLYDFFIFVKSSIKNYLDPNYFLISLLALVNSNPEIALAKIKIWIKTKDIFHELKIIIFNRLKKIKKVPKKSRPLMAEYYFVLDLKYALSKEIKKIKIKNQTCNLYSYDYYTIPDPILKITPWQEYLLKLIYFGYNNSEISEITQLSRKTIINERKKLYVYV
jgi:hypothetical protein